MSEHTTVNSALSSRARDLQKLSGPGLAQWRTRRHLLDTKDLSKDELSTVLNAASICKEMMDQKEGPQPLLPSVTIANVFYENSTRTRSSFELASKRLGATVLNLDIASSSVAKGETIADTGRTLIAMSVDALVQRHQSSGAAQQMAQQLGDRVHIVNAGDGWNAHPTQALLDYFTMTQIRGDLSGAKVAIIGDITHSRVARSNIWLLNKLGVDVHVSGPPTLMPCQLQELGVTVHNRPEAAIENADFVMVLRLQLERQKQGLIPSIGEYRRLYRIDHSMLKLASKDARVFHPGPMNRDLEISSELADDQSRSMITTQVANGVAVRMAVLYLLLSSGE